LGIGRDDRVRCCRRLLGTWSETNVGELLDLRKSGPLWEGTESLSADLRFAYERALRDTGLEEDHRRPTRSGTRPRTAREPP
jgi:hypothetical protein